MLLAQAVHVADTRLAFMQIPFGKPLDLVQCLEVLECLRYAVHRVSSAP
ncbi:hypothetical protein QFZ98_005010 [Paraburkholderia youngii]